LNISDSGIFIRCQNLQPKKELPGKKNLRFDSQPFAVVGGGEPMTELVEATGKQLHKHTTQNIPKRQNPLISLAPRLSNLKAIGFSIHFITSSVIYS
jgi:hypothetical protein